MYIGDWSSDVCSSALAVTGFDWNVNDPFAGVVVITTDANPFAGLSSGSVNPKSAATNVCEPSSLIVTEPSVPARSEERRVGNEGRVWADASQLNTQLA